MKTSHLSCFAALLAAFACLTQLAGAQAIGAITGTWFGSIVISHSDGKVSHDTAVLVIKQSGPRLEGGMGATIDQLSPWTDGTLTNRRLRFHLSSAGGLNVNLKLFGKHLGGIATGRNFTAQIDLKPAPGLLPHQQLQHQIMDADSQLFEAFDHCDVTAYSKFLSKDLEFYHDRTGKTNDEENLKALRDRCAEGIQLRRELEPDSLIVNAVPGFGAIQAGVERFYSRSEDGHEHLDATVRFTNVWSKQSGTWKLVRVISYDHR